MNIFILLPLLYVIFKKIGYRKAVKLFEVNGLKVYVIASNEVNAFVDGKKLFITRGALNLSDDEIEVLLSHELSHVVLHHSRFNILLTFLILFTVSVIAQFSLFLSFLVSLLSLFVQRHIRRRQEVEADRLASLVVGKERLASLIRKYDNPNSSLLSTHPPLSVDPKSPP